MIPQDFILQFWIDDYQAKFKSTGDIKNIDTSSEEFIQMSKMLKEYARIMCQKQKEVCAVVAKTKQRIAGNGYSLIVDIDSILNSPLPNELQDEI